MHLAAEVGIGLIWRRMENSDAVGPQRTSAQERWHVVQSFRRSGLTQANFAKQNGLSVHTLRLWLYRPGSKRRPKITFRELKMPSIPVPGNWAAEIVLDSGMTLRVGACAQPELISFLLKNLRHPQC